MSSTVVFSSEQAAVALWSFGEDSLVDRAFALTEAEVRRLWVVAGGHWRVDHSLPLKSQLSPDKVIAFTCIEYFEGQLRPLNRERRRPEKDQPEHLRNAKPFQGSTF